MKTFAFFCGITAVVALLAVTTGCEQHVEAAAPSGNRLSQMHGKTVTVQFRRDALGASANLPVSPMTSGINGATVAVVGKLRSFDDAWLALETENSGVVFVPKEVVLLVQVH